ncbi:MAG: efflux RND transporter periplasmic adaptor subunit [Candidatus Omnitrophica bacterium]|nr:efflux RND transporter periplasmic adaptor subunit [Candidatus Omnitrophota bacterium]
MKNNLLYLILAGLLFLPVTPVWGQDHQHKMVPVKDEQGEVSHYTCGMHPSVRVSVENYEKGDTKCPICFMPLTLVEKGGGDMGAFGENVISKVTIKARELKLAGVEAEPVERRQLFKEIRAVGKVAYDPQLAIAQDEFISAVSSSEKAQKGGIEEIIKRARQLVGSSKRKLLLLGLNEAQIKDLEATKKVQENLILPKEKMWVYGDVYEYELNWVKEGSFVKVKPIGMSGEEFYGEIVSINPVVDAQTRSVRFRALIDNLDRKLKPEMYVDIEIMSQYTDLKGNEEILSIPKSALLDTGRRTIVWVHKGDGDFEGRRVEIGPESIDHSLNPRKYYPVLKGLKQGEKVVTKGNFLIDSQSQITGVASAAYGGALGDEQKSSLKNLHAGHGGN